MTQSDTVGEVVSAATASGSGSPVVKLTGVHSLRTAATLRGSLLQALEGQGPIVIDLNEIDDADVGTLQVLIAAERSARVAGRDLSFTVSAGSPTGRLLIAVGAVAAESPRLASDTTGWAFQRGN